MSVYKSVAAKPDKQVFISFGRGLSMFTIVLCHYLQFVPLPPLLAKGTLLAGGGVYAFLFISSYGLSFSRASSWADFYRKRFRSVLLPYYLALTLIFVLNLAVGIYPEGWPAYLSHVLLYKMFYEPYVQSFGAHFWFISTIVQFYLLWPLLLALAARLPVGWFVGLAFAVSLLYTGLLLRLGVQQQRVWASSAVQYAWLFALGLAAARQRWVPRLLALGPVRHALLLAAGLAGTLLLNQLAGARGNSFNDYFIFLVFAAGAMLLYGLGQRVPAVLRFGLWVESFGYSLYLTHLFVFALYLAALTGARPNAYTRVGLPHVLVALALSFGVALLFDKLVKWLLTAQPGPVALPLPAPTPAGREV